MRPNHTKDRLRNGQTVFGSALQHFRSAEVPRLFAAAGFDYVFIDTEHGGFDLETVQDMVAASVRSSITPVVRVGELAYSLVARVLDVGAQGIIFPRVEDPRVLEEAVSWTKFPPAGKRGFGIMAPLLDYEPATFPAIMRHLDDSTLVVVQFETRRALERRAELLAVRGIDVAMIGPSDLSISLGVAGEFEHPILVSAIDEFIEDCRHHQVVPGIQCRSVAQARFWAQRGMRFVGAASELGLLLERSKQAVGELQAAVPSLAAANR